MESLIDLGYPGMFVAAFIAGSVFPFSSEAVMVALLTAGLSPWGLFVWGTLGNVGGSMFNFYVGRMGKMEWIERYLHVKREKIERTQRFMEGRGSWIGVLCFLPVLGSAIAVTLGFMRANPITSLVSIGIGKAVRYAVLIIAVTGFSVACTGNSPADDKVVMVSIEPLRWAAEQVLDSTWTVKVLVPQGANPETYEPTAQDMVELSRARYYFHTGGLGFEIQTSERLQQNAPGTEFVNLTAHLSPPERGDDGSPSPLGEGRSGAAHHHHDPHIWASPRGMKHIVDTMAGKLDVESNADGVALADSLMRLLPRGTAFAIYHPSLTTLAHDYGLHQICIETDGKEPSPAQLAATIDRCRELGVRVIFVQQEFDSRNAEQIASQIGARLVTINPLGPDWLQEILLVYDALIDASSPQIDNVPSTN